MKTLRPLWELVRRKTLPSRVTGSFKTDDSVLISVSTPARRSALINCLPLRPNHENSFSCLLTTYRITVLHITVLKRRTKTRSRLGLPRSSPDYMSVNLLVAGSCRYRYSPHPQIL